jgi:hypothetical protein
MGLSRLIMTRSSIVITQLPDKDAEKEGDLCVIDESGEDYLFSADRFVAIDVPAAVRAALVKASWRSLRCGRFCGRTGSSARVTRAVHQPIRRRGAPRVPPNLGP